MPIRKSKPTLDLNRADERALAALALMGRDIAIQILRRRPFKSWEDFKQTFGFDEDYARLLRTAGATLRIAPALSKRKPVKRPRPKPRFKPPLIPSHRRAILSAP